METAAGARVTAGPPSPAASCAGYVALTFDDGPSATNTATLLATLTAAGARATLLDIGQNAQANPDLVRAEAAAGMRVQNHSWTLRPPYLDSDATVRAVEASFGLTEINADVDSQDSQDSQDSPSRSPSASASAGGGLRCSAAYSVTAPGRTGSRGR